MKKKKLNSQNPKYWDKSKLNKPKVGKSALFVVSKSENIAKAAGAIPVFAVFLENTN